MQRTPGDHVEDVSELTLLRSEEAGRFIYQLPFDFEDIHFWALRACSTRWLSLFPWLENTRRKNEQETEPDTTWHECHAEAMLRALRLGPDSHAWPQLCESLVFSQLY